MRNGPTILIPSKPLKGLKDIPFAVLQAYLSQGWVMKGDRRLTDENGEELLAWELEYRPNSGRVDVAVLVEGNRLAFTIEDDGQIDEMLAGLEPGQTHGLGFGVGHEYGGFEFRRGGQVVSVYGSRVMSVNPLGVWTDRECAIETYLLKRVIRGIDSAVWERIKPYVPSKHRLDEREPTDAIAMVS